VPLRQRDHSLFLVKSFQMRSSESGCVSGVRMLRKNLIGKQNRSEKFAFT